MTTATCEINKVLAADCTYVPHSYSKDKTQTCKKDQVVLKDNYISGDLYCVSQATASGQVPTTVTAQACSVNSKNTSFKLAMGGDYCDYQKDVVEGCSNSYHPTNGKCACTSQGGKCNKGQYCSSSLTCKDFIALKDMKTSISTSDGFCGNEQCKVGFACYNDDEKKDGSKSGSVCLRIQSEKTTTALGSDSFILMKVDNKDVSAICYTSNGVSDKGVCTCNAGGIGPCTIPATPATGATAAETVCTAGQNAAIVAPATTLSCVSATVDATNPQTFNGTTKAVKCGDKIMNEWKGQACFDKVIYPLCPTGYDADVKCFCSAQSNGGTTQILEKGQVCLNKTFYGCAGSKEESFSYDAKNNKIEKCKSASKSNTGLIVGIIIAVIVVIVVAAVIVICLKKKNSGSQKVGGRTAAK